MMNIRIVLMTVWSLVIIGLESHPLKQLSEVNELEMLDNVLLYYNRIYRWSSNARKAKPYDTEAVALIRATYMTFWLIVTLKTFSIHNSCIFENEPEKNIDLYLDEMTFAFSEFKKEIKKYRASEKKEKEERNAGSSGKHITVEEVADKILDLNLDFLSSKKITNYRNDYPALFPSCPLIRYLVHKTIVENLRRDTSNQVGPSNTWIDPDLLQLYNENNTYTDTSGDIIIEPQIDLVNTSPNIREVLEKFYNSSVYTNIFEEELSDDEIFSIYSNNVYWQNIIQDLELMYGFNVETVIYNILRNIVWQVINVQEFHTVEDFLMDKIAGSSANFEHPLILDYNTLKIWNDVKNKNFMNENGSDISTQNRIENVIKFIRCIEEVKRNTSFIK